jgi:hypothetical protein
MKKRVRFEKRREKIGIERGQVRRVSARLPSPSSLQRLPISPARSNRFGENRSNMKKVGDNEGQGEGQRVRERADNVLADDWLEMGRIINNILAVL